ncbi:hypothetical protein SKAU_G00087580 [Synaphobranchus kaupii]|uniref:Uncharacterized protein n=1 Tax=Synaphobranchus kaupii TaxID=118154 RepID=A0A9Q1J3X9_SYNKA|nr:hypothetical protein SKAU_G00087580 [Synaphobranchus kaupii]
MCDTLDLLKTMSLQFQQNDLIPGEAVEYLEVCVSGMTELSLQPGEQHAKMLTDAEAGVFKGVELSNVSEGRLDSERKRITNTLITHIESRLGDLSTQSLVAKFHALNHHNWPSGEDFILHGQQDFEALCRHYQAILQHEGTSSSEVMAEYRLYKVCAKNRKGPLRETLQEILQRGPRSRKPGFTSRVNQPTEDEMEEELIELE